MVLLNDIVFFLDKYLDTKNFDDHFTNGLVVVGAKTVTKIALAVDPCIDVLKKAKKQGCKLIITHHGIFSNDDSELNEVNKKRIDFLKKNKIALYISHHPLDVHEKIGNSKIMANLLGLKNQKPFFKIGEHFYGISGELEIDINELKENISKKIGSLITVHDFGLKITKRIAIVSGSGCDAINCMKKENIDTLITGTPKHHAFYEAKELKLNVFYAGHYATEVFGVKTVGEKLKSQYNELNMQFIDSVTNL
ncbi:Nif3-like dinuclear metal center hexameric protein [archaeon]|nr:Nif3-like dinuclear metal center hexameric protein [archaeon]